MSTDALNDDEAKLDELRESAVELYGEELEEMIYNDTVDRYEALEGGTVGSATVLLLFYNQNLNEIAHYLESGPEEIPEDFFQKHREYVPSKWVALREARLNESKVRLIEGQYRCKNKSCGSKYTTTKQEQKRSADEPMTITVECMECHTRYTV